MIQRLLLGVTGATLLLALSSCTPSTPSTRIESNPVIYEALNSKDKELVKQGTIAKGMSKKAVYLAWGHPSSGVSGSRNGTDFERWIYTSYRPVYSNRFFGDYGYRWGRHRHPYYGVGLGPEVDYVPEQRAYVEFRKEKVHSWERRR